MNVMDILLQIQDYVSPPELNPSLLEANPFTIDPATSHRPNC